MTPTPQSCTRSIPLHMSRMKSLTGCKVVVRIEESMTVITQAYITVMHTSMTCQGTTATLQPGTSFG